jgi:hypothetical protein
MLCDQDICKHIVHEWLIMRGTESALQLDELGIDKLRSSLHAVPR